MIPALKEAATKLKESGVQVVAVDCQRSPAVAKQLGIQGYPSLKWLKLEDGTLVVADYQGGRDAESFVRFGIAAAKQGSLRSKLGASQPAPAEEGGAKQAEGGAAGGSKLGASKLGGSKLGGSKLAASGAAGDGKEAAGGAVKKAKMPAEAEAEAPGGVKQPTEPAPVAA